MALSPSSDIEEGQPPVPSHKLTQTTAAKSDPRFDVLGEQEAELLCTALGVQIPEQGTAGRLATLHRLLTEAVSTKPGTL